MPQMRKLSPEEVQAIENKGVGVRKQTEHLYDSILADYALGDYGEAVLDEADNRLTVRNRLKAAAGRRNLGIGFRRTNGDLLRFQIVEPVNGSNGNRKHNVTIARADRAPVSTDKSPTKHKGGRPKAAEKGAMERLEKLAGKVQDAAKGALVDIGLREPAKRKGGRPKKNV